MNKLLSLKITNFCSFYDKQTLVFDHKNNSNITAIYGPNASGKSNTAKALSFIKYFIINSADAKNINIPYEPFQLIQDNLKPTSFEIEFIYDNHKIPKRSSRENSKRLLTCPQPKGLVSMRISYLKLETPLSLLRRLERIIIATPT